MVWFGVFVQGGDYNMYGLGSADLSQDQEPWFDGSKPADRPRAPGAGQERPLHQGPQGERPLQPFKNRNRQDVDHRSPVRASATATSGQGVVGSLLHTKPPVSEQSPFCLGLL